MAKQKQTFQCYQCKETFDLLIDLEEQPVLMGYCPYCKADWEVDFTPENSTVIIHKNTTQKTAGIKQLPAIIVTEPRKTEK
ncbi:hypothetical protein [Beggiatoa leptomitoformis]|uniref:Uncharacterized protein n=1 Tax=Beggiatoa leptomitoformis TaxID=288004 RepID=A0A2N9YCQ4_9GAMM|nr:hypothetical protein [Beggiatoa leptomitoformis]ALG66483.1 hypothetical protein AL038_00445 [Beggiatoa leptomitoformis]AUI68226.1 hypothetical protein BLE401_05600 [Beggiatoa leptomitoformis]